MKTFIALSISAISLASASAANAQSETAIPPTQTAPASVTLNQPVQPAMMVVPATPTSNAVLPAGTSVRLRLLSELHSQRNRTGETFDLEVAEDVLHNGVVVIPRGSIARGEVTRSRRRGMWGRSGRMETRLLSVRANGVNIPITGTVAERGETGTAGVVASIVVLPVAGFFVTGTSAVLPAGTGFSGRTESDIPLLLPADAVPQPAVVAIPVQQPTSSAPPATSPQ
jgi:hypothetical protein